MTENPFAPRPREDWPEPDDERIEQTATPELPTEPRPVHDKDPDVVLDHEIPKPTLYTRALDALAAVRMKVTGS